MNQTQQIIMQLGSLSYVGVFGVSLIANILFVIPEEVVLLGLGYVARAGKINIYIIIPIVILGLLTSDFILYLLSRGNNRIISFFYDSFFSKKLAIFSKKKAREEQWYETHIEKVIFFSRFLIQLRFLGPYMAGRLQVPRRKFVSYELAALLIYVPLLIWTGWIFRSHVEQIIVGLGHIRNLILIAVGIILLISLIQYLSKKSKYI